MKFKRIYYLCLIILPIASYVVIHQKYTKLQALQCSLEKLQTERDKLNEEKERLVRTLESSRDFSWLELLLMKNLGVVSEGQEKVYFVTPESKEDDQDTEK